MTLGFRFRSVVAKHGDNAAIGKFDGMRLAEALLFCVGQGL